jgi:regulator of CtrA degradation
VRNAFVDRLHNEALALLLASRDRAARAAARPKESSDLIGTLTVTMASLYLTALTTDTVAWTLVQKAVAAGELDQQEALSDFWAPAALAQDGFASSLPAELATLIERAEILHRRVAFLHAQRRIAQNACLE